MAKELGPTFGDEVLASSVAGAPFSWGKTSDEIYGRDNLSAEQNTALDGVVAAHDPTKEKTPVPTTEQAVGYDHENRIRALEGQPPLSFGDFLTKVKHGH